MRRFLALTVKTEPPPKQMQLCCRGLMFWKQIISQHKVLFCFFVGATPNFKRLISTQECEHAFGTPIFGSPFFFWNAHGHFFTILATAGILHFWLAGLAGWSLGFTQPRRGEAGWHVTCANIFYFGFHRSKMKVLFMWGFSLTTP